MNCELLRTMHKGIIYLEDEECGGARCIDNFRLVIGIYAQVIGRYLVAVEDDFVALREVLEGGRLPCDVFQRLAFRAVRSGVEDGEERAVRALGQTFGVRRAFRPFAIAEGVEGGGPEDGEQDGQPFDGARQNRLLFGNCFSRD